MSLFFHPERPFAPRRFPVFYGWVVLATSTLGVLMSMPGQTMGVSVFTDPLLAVTGLSRLDLSNIYLLGTICSGLMLPFGGRMLDRIGGRQMVVLSSVILGAVLVYLANVDRIAVGIFGRNEQGNPNTIGVGIALFVGFTLLRFAGQGLLTMTSRTVMGKWFERRRGLASAIMGTAIAGGFGVTPWLFGEVLDGFGWRGAWLLMAAVVGIGMGLIAWLLVRDNPEECGLEMDGGAAESADAPAGKRREPRVEVRTYHEATRGQALRTVAFWATSGALAVQGLVITGITFHLEAIGAESGLGRDASRMLFMPMAVVATIVGALAGLACDYVRIKWLLITMGCFQALGFAASAHLDSSLGWWLAVVGLGFSGGFFGPISSVAMPRFFGRANLGAINGVQMMVMVLSSAIGPSFLALFERYGGSFGPGLYWSCAFPLVVSIVALWATNPQVRWKHTPPIG